MGGNVLPGFLDAVGGLEKPRNSGEKLEQQIPRSKTIFVLDVDLYAIRLSG